MNIPETALEDRTAYTVDEWQARLFDIAGGRDQEHLQHVTFVCPMCHETHSVREFYEAAKDRGDDMHEWDPTVAAQECLHRFLDDGQCDWCAYGLFRGPVIVTDPDGGTTGVFPFGQPEAAES